MKIYVDEMPDKIKDCFFHDKWHPYPPIIEEAGYWECKLGGECKIENCKYLKVLKDDIIQ